MGHPVDDAIAAAGGILQQMWKNPKAQAPENDLNPNPGALAFRCQLLEQRVDLLERTLGDLIRELRQRK